MGNTAGKAKGPSSHKFSILDKNLFRMFFGYNINSVQTLIPAFFRCAVEPQYNELLRDWENVFVITRVRYIGVRFHIFRY